MFQKIVLNIVCIIPSNFMRVFIYRKLLGYKIGKNVHIGKSKIKCKKVIIYDNVYIGNKNTISCNELILEENSKILSENSLVGKANFFLGKNSRVINNHIIDLWNDVSIGADSWIAGSGSQLWTHGSLSTKLNKKLSIKIEDNVYISSNVLISAGVHIESINLIGLGSVVTRSITSSNNIVIGNPSEIVKSDIDWRENW
jgi:acetyltransferase-like isoleucine patch superfamily enzyme